MPVSFAKMEGAGNDFVVIADGPRRISRSEIVTLCDRRTGVGGDGLVLLDRERRGGDACFRVHCYNPDGSRVITCLNAFRCAARRATELAWSDGAMTFDTDRGTVGAKARAHWVELEFEPPEVDVSVVKLPDNAPAAHGSLISLGDPHLVVELGHEALCDIDFAVAARTLRHWMGLPRGGANVHFVARVEGGNKIRSFERGIEGETMACGSGCVAATCALRLTTALQRVSFSTRSGASLVVCPGVARWSIAGPARTVFTGVLPHADEAICARPTVLSR